MLRTDLRPYRPAAAADARQVSLHLRSPRKLRSREMAEEAQGEDAPPRLGFLASCDHGVAFKCAEDAPAPMPDEDAASGKIDYVLLNQIAKLCGRPAVSGAPVNQIACVKLTDLPVNFKQA